MIYLGIDPGSRVTGYAFLEKTSRRLKVLEYGVIRCPQNKSLYERIEMLVAKLDELLEIYKPSVLTVEEVFFAKNAKSALVLGQARGAIIGAASRYQMRFREFSAKEIKLTVTGRGQADKAQVALMIKQHLELREIPTPEDASDALAVAWVGATKKEFL